MSEDYDETESNDDQDESDGTENDESNGNEYPEPTFDEMVNIAKKNYARNKLAFKDLIPDLDQINRYYKENVKDSDYDESDDSDQNSTNDDDDDDENEFNNDNDDEYEYEEEEEEFSDTESYTNRDGESEDEFEEIPQKEDKSESDDHYFHFRYYDEEFPKWLEQLLPSDLLNALKNKLNKPTNRGRTTSINADNVNDFAYYVKNGKHGIKEPLKGRKKLTPFEYSGDNCKYKCHAYIGLIKSKCVYTPFEDNSNAPAWYKYLYIYQCIPHSVPTDTLYDLIYDCPSPINYIWILIDNFNKGNRPLKLLKRTKKDKEKDINFYKGLSDSDKDALLYWIGHKLIYFDVKDYIESIKDYRRIGIMVGYVKLFEYFMSKNLLVDFRKFVDSNHKVFKHLRHYKIIRPEFRALYPYAFSQTTFKRNDKAKRFNDYVKVMINNRWYQEINFIKSKRWTFNCDMTRYALKTNDKKIYKFLIDSESIPEVMEQFVLDSEKYLIKEYFEKGLRPRKKLIFALYKIDFTPDFLDNFEVLKYIPKNQNLDGLKYYLTIYHPELIEDFLLRFRNRVTDIKPDSWHLVDSIFPDKFELACKVLNVKPSRYVHDIFEKSMKITMKNKEVEAMSFHCIKNYPDSVEIKTEYLRFALVHDKPSLVRYLLDAGAKLCDVEDYLIITRGRSRQKFVYENDDYSINDLSS